MKIYTKTGDRGQTSLFGGERVGKDSIRVEAYGSIDELNSVIGAVITESQNAKRKRQNHNSKLKTELIKIQHDLFTIGSALASSTTNNEPSTMNYLESRVTDFEHLIDLLTSKLPALSSFILPGGSRAGSLLHFARTVCRRAERRVVALAKKDPSTSSGQGIIIYLNRLSDLLFTMARFVNLKEKKKEIIWKNEGK